MSCPASYCNPNKSDNQMNSKQKCVALSTSKECKDDRENTSCSVCPDNRSVLSGSLRCAKRCNKVLTLLITFAVFLALFVLIGVLFLIRASNYIDEHIQLRAKLGPYARSFIFFCQFIFLLCMNSGLDDNYLHFEKFISKTGLFLTYDLCFTLGLTSSRGRVFEEYFVYLTGYLMIAALALLIFCVLSRCLKIYHKFSILIYVTVTYSYFTYAPIAFTTFRLLSCGFKTPYNSTTGDQIQSSRTWLYDARESCTGTNWDALMSAVAILTLILYLIPLPLIYILFATICKRLAIRKFYYEHVRKIKPTRERERISTRHAPSKLTYCAEFIKEISYEYVCCFSESHFGFWIPITMIASFCLVVLKTNSIPLGLSIEAQSQALAVVCFLFLYIRVSLKITTDIYVQIYDSFSILLLCLDCIFLIITQNSSAHIHKDQAFISIATYFPLFCYLLLFLLILSPPAIKFCVKRTNLGTPETEEKQTLESSFLLTIDKVSDDEANEQSQALLDNDRLGQMNDLVYQQDMSNSYGSHQSQGNGSSQVSVNLDSLGLSHENQRDD